MAYQPEKGDNGEYTGNIASASRLLCRRRFRRHPENQDGIIWDAALSAVRLRALQNASRDTRALEYEKSENPQDQFPYPNSMWP